MAISFYALLFFTNALLCRLLSCILLAYCLPLQQNVNPAGHGALFYLLYTEYTGWQVSVLQTCSGDTAGETSHLMSSRARTAELQRISIRTDFFSVWVFRSFTHLGQTERQITKAILNTAK